MQDQMFETPWHWNSDDPSSHKHPVLDYLQWKVVIKTILPNNVEFFFCSAPSTPIALKGGSVQKARVGGGTQDLISLYKHVLVENLLLETLTPIPRV